MSTALPAVTAVLALGLSIALFDQWRRRRGSFQLAWAIGMGFFGIGSACEAIAASGAWSDLLYRAWYLSGAVLTPAWLGLGTALLLAKTRFGYAYAVCFLLAGVFTILTQAKYAYPESGSAGFLYLISGIALAVAIFTATYFGVQGWPRIAAFGVVLGTVLGLGLVASATLLPGSFVDTATGEPTAALFPGYLRLLTPFMNVTGAFSLLFGAIFSAYVFMPKRRVLDYSLDTNQPFDHFLFNLAIGVVAIAVNLVASLPRAFRAWRAGTLNSRVPATVLIAIGAFVAAAGDTLNRVGITSPFAIAKLIAAVLLVWGFLVSVDAFRDIRIPFTSIRLGEEREERGSAG
ncbi:MAG: hypothetical protein HY263_07305 [Chloroflexi bacterium]|nr:hypothetical protein [Chloroflexota bacterium]